MRAAEVCRAALERYERPAIEPDLEHELESYVTRRRAELGD
jgi:trimethylamine:corrinoid methyltransferase-like protein